MAGWHHGLDGHESEWTLGDGDGQGGLVCCDSWGHQESDTTERLNWTDRVNKRIKGGSYVKCLAQVLAPIKCHQHYDSVPFCPPRGAQMAGQVTSHLSGTAASWEQSFRKASSPGMGSCRHCSASWRSAWNAKENYLEHNPWGEELVLIGRCEKPLLLWGRIWEAELKFTGIRQIQLAQSSPSECQHKNRNGKTLSLFGVQVSVWCRT